MRVSRLHIYISSMLIFVFCTKDSNSNDEQNIDLVKNEFEELGNDGPYEFGQKYNGRNSYISYQPGNIPVILSIPHGGEISPSEISDRTYGVSVTDSNTIELGIAISDYLFSQHNVRPYLVINNLKRTKLDAN